MSKYTPEQIAAYREQIRKKARKANPRPRVIQTQPDNTPSWVVDQIARNSFPQDATAEDVDDWRAAFLATHDPIPGEPGWYWNNVTGESYNGRLDPRLIIGEYPNQTYLGHDSLN